MMNLPDRREAVFILDPEAGLTPDNRWTDTGPHGLHATPVNYVAPNYGLVTMASGAQAYSFNGATQYATLPLRFYDFAPTSECTFVVAARWSTPGLGDHVFDCVTAGVGGIRISTRAGAAERLVIAAVNGATSCLTQETNNAPLTGRTWVAALTMRVVTTATEGRSIWLDGNSQAVTPANTAATIAYNTAAVPTIGAVSGGGANYFDDRLYHLSLWPRVLTTAEICDITLHLRNRM